MKMSKIILLAFIIGLSACGRYVAPLAPEFFAPAAIKDLQITSFDDKIVFDWKAPDKDQRSEDLRQIDGYSVLRKGPAETAKKFEDLEFEEIAFIPDTHLIVRKQLRDEAIKEGRLSRKIKAPEELKQFSIEDSQLEKDMYYLYEIVPVNQGGVEGAVFDRIQLNFNGKSTKTLLIGSGASLTAGQLTEEEASEQELNNNQAASN